MHVQQSTATIVSGDFNDRGPSFEAPPPPERLPKHGDRIGRSPFPNWPSATGAAGGLTEILSQLMGLLQQLMSALGRNGGSVQPFFDSAQASSTGDPHLAFDGSTEAGRQQAHFDSMDDHPDLLDSTSFRGGFQVGTSVTRPDANGVTWNRRAAVTTDFGATQVSLDNAGHASVLHNGKSLELLNGQTMRFGNETVARNADGSLVISDKNRSGGYVTTTLRGSGLGVDVSVDAHAVALGGDLVRRR
jgi:hypothetical protein